MKAFLLAQEEIIRRFEDAGWRTTAWIGEEDALTGYDDDLLILAYESQIGSADSAFELYDGKFGLSYWVRVVPTPRQAAVLLRGAAGRPLRKERAAPRARNGKL